ncbi:MAG: hypothetical protein IJ812_02660 [Schwartzia sp.]|nr:hypothetical protein [Schwartzia sp. (in: firmicutes)]
MSRKFGVVSLYFFSLFILYGICGQLPIINAERVYCTTFNGSDYYIETNELSGTRSGLTYVGVYVSDGRHQRWCFEPPMLTNKYWRYTIEGTGESRKIVNDSKVANDILYVTLIEKEKKH